MARDMMNRAMPSEKDILRFVRQEMSADEAASFKKEMENDPFLRDAVEGFSEIHPELAEEIVSDLKKDVAALAGTNGSVGVKWYALAASLLLLAASVFVLKNLYQNGEGVSKETSQPVATAPEENLFQENVEEFPAADAVTGSPLSLAEKPLEQPSDVSSTLEKNERIQANSNQSDVITSESEPDIAISHTKNTTVSVSGTVVSKVQAENKDQNREVEPASAQSMPGSADYLSEDIFLDKAEVSGKVDSLVSYMLAFSTAYAPVPSQLKTKAPEKSDADKKKFKAVKDCETCPPKPEENDLSASYAMTKYQEGDYAVANKYFEQALIQDPSNAQLKFYQVLTLIHLGKSSEAETRIAGLGNTLSPDVNSWLNAANMIRKGDKANGKKILKELSATKSPFATEAGKAIKELEK